MNVAEYGQALAMLESLAGIDVLRLVDAKASTADGKGEWTLRTKGGVEVAVANPREGLCECFLLPGWQVRGTVTVARPVTLRVLCTCGHPKVLPWPVRSGDSYTCLHCSATCFVSTLSG